MPWWLWPNVLSLDAPLVALVWHAAGAQAFAVPFSGLTAWLLVSSVWMIYALDRLLDGRGGPGKTPETQRHAFHRRHQRGFAACLGGGLILNAVLLLWVDAPLLRFGVGLLVASGGYGLMVHCLRRSWLPKELVCGGVFSVGVMGSLPIESFPWGGVSLFAVLCTANCLVIACGEVGIDRRSDALAGPQRWPWLRETMGWGLGVFALGTAGLAGFAAGLPERGLWVAMAVSSLGLVAVGRAPRSSAWKRVMADVCLLSPLLLWPWLAP